MPRLKPISRKEAPPAVIAVYDSVFGERDPVAEPGTSTGSPGDWWTTMAIVPEILESFVEQFAVFNSKSRELPARLRELALCRAGFIGGSKFVYSQHSKVARAIGVKKEQVDAIPAWPLSDDLEHADRCVLQYVDELLLQSGRVQETTFNALRKILSEPAILELSVAAASYHLHGILCRALRIEFDDAEEWVTEVPGPPNFKDEDLLSLVAQE